MADHYEYEAEVIFRITVRGQWSNYDALDDFDVQYEIENEAMNEARALLNLAGPDYEEFDYLDYAVVRSDDAADD